MWRRSVPPRRIIASPRGQTSAAIGTHRDRFAIRPPGPATHRRTQVGTTPPIGGIVSQTQEHRKRPQYLSTSRSPSGTGALSPRAAYKRDEFSTRAKKPTLMRMLSGSASERPKRIVRDGPDDTQRVPRRNPLLDVRIGEQRPLRRSDPRICALSAPAVTALLWDQWLDARVYPKPPGPACRKS